MWRRLIPACAVAAWVSGPAFAQPAQQSSSPSLGIPLNSERLPTEEEIQKRKDADRAYDAAIHKIPDKKPSADPWGNIRPNSPATAKNKQQPQP
ncbi:MAG TPA: hypothetical protein VEJ37_00210 [Xanthobacteraceae bacterium]|nr:hypothetical protein [Xanthobacteraceae bacterium]